MALDAAVPCSCAARRLECTHEDREVLVERVGSSATVRKLWDALESLGEPAAVLREAIGNPAPTDIAACRQCLAALDHVRRHHPRVADDHVSQLFALDKLFRAALEHDTCVVWL